jgi:hypothetical protein
MKNNKKIIIASIIAVIIVTTLGLYWFFTNQDSKTTLTIIEKQWIETNKHKVFDLGVSANIPVFNIEGEGLFFDFLDSFEEATKLNFNKVVYANSSNLENNYAFRIVDKTGEKDILMYRDHYVLVTKDKIKYASASDIKDLTIGVMQNNIEEVTKYLSSANNLTYKSLSTAEELINSISSVDAIVIPLNINLEKIISSANLNVSYHITEMTQDYVISLGDNDTLNTILKKYYKK